MIKERTEGEWPIFRNILNTSSAEAWCSEAQASPRRKPCPPTCSQPIQTPLSGASHLAPPLG
jgi:hypothetical protein